MEQKEATKYFKSLDDLREMIKELELVLARPTRRLSHPTLYRNRDVAPEESLILGVRERDWTLSPDLNWVLPDNQSGLSFSASWKDLKRVHKMIEKHNPGAAINVYWLLEQSDLPKDMKFVVDANKSSHYFLTVTRKMPLPELVSKLKLVAKKMSVMKDARKAL